MWTYNGTEFNEDMIEDAVGFVYLIVNNDNRKHYIGKKLFTKSKQYQVKLKKKKKRVSSDWIEYVGSNVPLQEDINEGAVITKTILHLCKSKGWMSWLETKEIINRDALRDERYYNSWVSCKIHAKHLT